MAGEGGAVNDQDQSFTDTPVSIGEARAKKLHRGDVWTPRDCVIAFLRALDAGEIKAEQVIICYSAAAGDGATKTRYFSQARSALEAYGMLARVQHLMQTDG